MIDEEKGVVESSETTPATDEPATEAESEAKEEETEEASE